LKNERGFALIITLLITALLVALTAEFVNEVYVDTSERQSFVDGQQASLLAGSGMTAATTLLKFLLQGQTYTSLTDLTSLGIMLQAADDRVRVSIEEESGKLNINAIVNPNGKDNDIYRPIAERLFKKLGLQPELLDAVADWIDSDNEPRPYGAETAYYQTLKPPYAAKNGPLETLEELRLVKGFDKATVDKLRPYLTVYYDNALGGTAPVNVNTAPKELLASLDEKMTDGLAQQIVDYRTITPLKSSTDLGNSVAGMETLSLELSSNFRIMGAQEQGSIFRIISQATVNGTVRVIEAVYRKGGQPSFLYWREY
jgi:general secretion pathway protein K